MHRRLAIYLTAGAVFVAAGVGCKTRRRDGAKAPNRPAAGPSAGPTALPGARAEGNSPLARSIQPLADDPGLMLDGNIYVPVPKIPRGLQLTGDEALSEVVDDAFFDQKQGDRVARVILHCTDADFEADEDGGDDPNPVVWRFYVRAKVEETARSGNWRNAAAARLTVVEPFADPDTGEIDACPGVLTGLRGFNQELRVQLEGKFVRERVDTSERLVYAELESDPFYPRKQVHTRFVQRQVVAEEARLESVQAASPGDLVAVGVDNKVYFRKVSYSGGVGTLGDRWVPAKDARQVVTTVKGIPAAGLLGLERPSFLDIPESRRRNRARNWQNRVYERADLDTPWRLEERFANFTSRDRGSIRSRFSDLAVLPSGMIFLLYDEYSPALRTNRLFSVTGYSAAKTLREVDYAPGTVKVDADGIGHTATTVPIGLKAITSIHHTDHKGLLAIGEDGRLYYSRNTQNIHFRPVGGAAPTTTAIVTDIGISNITHDGFMVSWQPEDGYTYHVRAAELGTSNSTTLPVADTALDTTTGFYNFAMGSRKASTDFEVDVIATDAAGTVRDVYTTASVTTLPVVTAPPPRAEPVLTAATSTEATVYVTHQDGDTVVARLQEDFGNVLTLPSGAFDANVVTSTSDPLTTVISFTGLTAGHVYALSAISTTGTVAHTHGFTLVSTHGTPMGFVDILPAYTEISVGNITASTIDLTWQESPLGSSPPLAYDVYVSRVGDLRGGALEVIANGGTARPETISAGSPGTRTITLTGLEEGVRYFFNVVARLGTYGRFAYTQGSAVATRSPMMKSITVLDDLTLIGVGADTDLLYERVNTESNPLNFSGTNSGWQDSEWRLILENNNTPLRSVGTVR